MGLLLLLSIDIVQEQIERIHTLDQPFFKLLKVIMGNDSWNRVKRKQLLVELSVLINAELDAVARHQPVDSLRVFNQFSHNHSS